MRSICCLLWLATIPIAGLAAGLDRNGNSLNDVWEGLYAAASLSPGVDTDGDGYSNLQESNAGTDPFNSSSRPWLEISILDGSWTRLEWQGIPGKHYTFLSGSTLSFSESQNAPAQISGNGSVMTFQVPTTPASAQFFRLAIADADTDGDGLNDYEERALGFNPASRNTDRFSTNDYNRATAGLSAANVISISTLDPLMSERWPDPGLVVIRRRGGLLPIRVNFQISGSATRGVDYSTVAEDSIQVPAGAREVWLELHPIADEFPDEADETIQITLQPGEGYTLGPSNSATLAVRNETADSGPSPKEAARFLIQAAFGPNADSADDPDQIPENVEEVMSLGLQGWIDDQFARPIGWLQPMAEWVQENGNALQLYSDPKAVAWWGRVMESPKLRPDANETQLPDPLRQRVAFALSEILVVSDRPEALNDSVGMANYYDTLVKHAFGNYRDLLFDVAMHPCMGIFLSHVGNRKADPVNRIYPDENFAREIMQLFSIGLWELNPDGTRQLDTAGQPIPSYDNRTITEMARVFTGLSFGGPDVNAFGIWPRDFTKPMLIWDAYHDCEAKTLLRGVTIPARTPSPGKQGLAGLADVHAAIENLFQHPNVGPFIGRQLIQRLVTSNPSPEYVARVSGAFANNGNGVRGDMKALIKAVLLDPEARGYAQLSDPAFGKLREPFLRCVNLARAFNASSTSGHYPLDEFNLDHGQEPQNAPSVFNFFLPTYSPPGMLAQSGLVAPEFQIVNASTAITSANYFWNCIWGGLHRWGAGVAAYNVRLDLGQELAMVVPPEVSSQDVPNVSPFDPDALLQRLDLVLTGGLLTPQQFQVIRETLERLPRPRWHWHREYLRAAIYLIVTSPEFSIAR